MNFTKVCQGFMKLPQHICKSRETNFEKANNYTWSSLQREASWSELQHGGITVNSVVAGSVNMGDLFDKRPSFCQILTKKKPEWEICF